MRQHVMMCCLPSLWLSVLFYEVRLLGPNTQSVQEAQLAVHCQRVGHLAGS